MSYGGGGFMSDQGGSQGSPDGGAKRSKDTMTLRPVTIKQILESVQPHPDAEFSIDGCDVTQITFVAKISNVNQSSNAVSYSFEDGTGTIDVRQWLESVDDDTGRTAGLVVDSLARVVGNPKIFSNRRFVAAVGIHPVTDYNEQQYHLLDAMYTHLVLTRGSLDNAHGGQAPHQAGHTAGAAAVPDISSDISDPTSRKIMQYIAGLGDPASLPDAGVDAEQIARHLKGSVEQLMPYLDDLISEGHLYTTTDETHVLPTG